MKTFRVVTFETPSNNLLSNPHVNKNRNNRRYNNADALSGFVINPARSFMRRSLLTFACRLCDADLMFLR